MCRCVRESERNEKEKKRCLSKREGEREVICQRKGLGGGKEKVEGGVFVLQCV